MSTSPPAREPTDEEWAQIEANRPKRPLNGPEIDKIREVLTWHSKMIEAREAARKAREAWRARFPAIFGAIGAMAAIISTALALWVKFK